MKKLVFGRYDYAVGLTFFSFANCSSVIPMCLVPLAVSLGFPLTEGGMGLGGMLQMGRSVPMVATMLLCGFFEAIWGKRRTLGASLLLMGASIILCSFAPSYAFLFLAYVAAGLGEGVIEGLTTPYVQDLHPDQPGRYMNLAHSLWAMGLVAMVLAAGLLLYRGVSWRIVVFIGGAMALLPALMFMWPNKSAKRETHASEEKVPWREICRRGRDLLRKKRFWIFFFAMLFAGGGEFCLTFWCATFILLEFDGSALAAGAGTACFAAGMFAGRLASGYWVPQRGLKKLIVALALAATIISLFFPWLASKSLLFPLLFLSGAAVGPFWPSIQSDGAFRVGGDHTMMMIFFSCAGVPGAGLFGMTLGVLGDFVGLRLSFFLVPFCFFAVFALMAYDMLCQKREGRSESSRIFRTDESSARVLS